MGYSHLNCVAAANTYTSRCGADTWYSVELVMNTCNMGVLTDHPWEVLLADASCTCSRVRLDGRTTKQFGVSRPHPLSVDAAGPGAV